MRSTASATARPQRSEDGRARMRRAGKDGADAAGGERRCKAPQARPHNIKCRCFCCPAHLPAAGIRFCYRVRPEPCSSIVTKAVRPTGYAAIANASLSLAFVGFERFYGAFRPGKNTVFQYTSILVRPRQPPCPLAGCTADGGAAGYCPRVRCIYSTASFIAISARRRHGHYKGFQRVFEGGSARAR